jgi:hypothetical protein
MEYASFRSELDALSSETCEYMIQSAKLEVDLASRMKWIAPQLYQATLIDLQLAQKNAEAAQMDIQATFLLKQGNIKKGFLLAKEAAIKRRNLAMEKYNAAQQLTDTNRLVEIGQRVDKLGRRTKSRRTKYSKSRKTRARQ